MRARTNLSLKERRRLTLKDFRGVDCSSSPVLVEGNRAAEGINWICERGVLQKRKGWNQVIGQIQKSVTVEREDGRSETVYEDAPINGIFPYKNQEGITEILVYAGTDFYYVKTEGGYSCTKMNNVPTGLENRRIQGFFAAGKIYLVGAGRYLCYDCKSHTIGAVDPYVPITTANIDDISVSDPVRKTVDLPNLLTRKRKNTLVGTRLTNYPGTDGSGATWQLDGKIDETCQVLVTLEHLDENGALETVELATNDQSQLQIIENGKLKGETKGKVWRDTGKIEIYRIDTTSPIENQANITVTFSVPETKTGEANKIDACRFGTIFGIDGAEDRLFLSGDPDYPNVAFFSESDRFDYFPDQYTASYGTKNSAVTGFLRLSDNTQAVFKEKSAGEAAIYYQTGHYNTVESDAVDDFGQTVYKYVPVFSMQAGSAAECSVNPWCCANLDGDSVFLSSRGVYAVELAENLATNVRTVRERARTVERHMRERNLRDAVGIVFDGKYYLAADGFCYVADARYRYTGGDSPFYQYEWQIWDNIPARTFAEIDGSLWFGTSDGRLCRFGKGYADRTFMIPRAGELSVDYTFHCMIYSKDWNISENDRIELVNPTGSKPYYAVYAKNLTRCEDHLYFELSNPDAINTVFEGDTVTVVDQGENATGVTECVIGEVDRMKGRFSLCDADGERYELLYPAEFPMTDAGRVLMLSGGTVTILKKLEGTYYAANVGGVTAEYVEYATNQTFGLRETSDPDSPILELSDLIMGENVSIRITHESPVRSVWQTPTFDMGDHSASKMLLSMTLSEDATARGPMTFGYETRSDLCEREMRGVEAFSFEDLDFRAFTFETGFQNSYTVASRTPFNYIRFCFVSDKAKPCSLSCFTATYKINKRKKGVT